MGIFSQLFNDDESSLADDKDFIRLIEVAREDQAIGQTLLQLLVIREPQRQHTLEKLIRKLSQDGAPGEFVRLLQIMRNPEIADEVLRVLKS